MRKFAIPLLLLVTAALLWLVLQPSAPQGPQLGEVELGPTTSSESHAEADNAAAARINQVELPSFDNRQTKIGVGKHQMSGVVVDESDNPVPGCWVAAYSVPFPLFDFTNDISEIFNQPLDFNLEPMASVFADEEGRFDLRGLEGRALYITARTKQRISPRRQRVLSENLNNTDKPVVVRTVAAASIRGQVLDATGQSVAGAEVLVGPGVKYLLAAFRNRNFFVERIFTDANGHFEIEAVPAGAALTINAWRGGVEGGMKEFGPLAASQDHSVNVSLFPLGSLEGKVVNEDEQAISNADVVALPLDLRLAIPFIRDPMLWTAKTNSKGAYIFNKLPHALYLLMAQGQQGRSAPLSCQVHGEGSLAGNLQIATKKIIEGRVVNGEGAPVARAVVKLMSIPSGVEEGSQRQRFNQTGGFLIDAAQEILPEIIPETTFAITNGKGEFKIPAWKRARLRVEAQGYAHFDFKLNQLNEGKSPVLQISKPGGIRGNVIDANSKEPIAIAFVQGDFQSSQSWQSIEMQLIDEDGNDANSSQPDPATPWLLDGEQIIPSGGSWRQIASATTFVDNAEGKFEISNLTPGKWQMKVQAEGYTANHHEYIHVKESEFTNDVAIELVRGASVSGRVVEAGTDNPIAGAVVTAGHGEESGFMAMLQGMGDNVAMAETDRQGFFIVNGVQDSADYVNVLADSYAAASTRIEPIQFQEQRTGITVEVPFGGTLTGTVYDRNNMPLPGRMVGAVSMQAKDFQQTAANADGVYLMSNLKAGSYIMVTAALDDESLFTGDFMTMLSGSKITTAVVRENQETVLDIIDSSAGGCRLEGEVLDRGKPVPNANIALFKSGGGSMLDFGLSTARSNKDGQFVFKSLEPGEYRAQIDCEFWNGALEIEVMDAAEDFIVLEIPVSNITGRLIAKGSGEPVSDVSLSLRGMGGGSSGMMSMMFGGGGSGGTRAGWANSQADGSFVFERVPAGRYQITANGGTDSNGLSFKEQKSTTFNIFEGSDFDVGNIELALGGNINVSAIFVGDSPRWFSVSATRQGEGDNKAGSKSSWGRVTEEASLAELEGLEPGLWDISVSADGFATSTAIGIEARPGEVTDCEVTLNRGARVKVSIRANGELVNADEVFLFDAQGKQVGQDRRDQVPAAFRGFIPAGQVDLGSYAPGSYRVQAKYGGEVRNTQVSLQAGVPAEVEINF